MSDVTCYEIDMQDAPHGGTIAKMEPHPNGRYVLHSDYIALALRLAARASETVLGRRK